MSFMKFDLSAVNTSNTFAAGEYPIRCTDVKVEDKNGNQFILATMEITEGAEQGRKIYERFTTVHTNPKAVQVGLGKLKRFLIAAGYKSPNELELIDMGGLECNAKVVIKESEGYDPKNEISSYKKKVASPQSAPSSPF